MDVRAALDALVMGRVIGDVLNLFVPAAKLIVQYESTLVTNGFDINPSSWETSNLDGINIAGKELMPYVGPQPPTVIHIYLFAVFKQKGVMETVKTRPVERKNFSTGKLAGENELGLPAAPLYFNSQKQPRTRNSSL
ncbi:Protein MOTHER of FT and TF 1 [Forsythia ovata]|uniref:Protein MOTHER of FT and TF 1 n=1 Tax=Forsythia ovata TaxID=205694 RepID=A0ABD1QAS1_9LAMI